MAVDTVADRVQQARRGVGVSGRGPGTAAPRKKRVLSTGAITMIAFAAPSLLLLLLINFYPLLYGIWQSLRHAVLPAAGEFVGVQNYVDVLTSPDFWARARFTVIFSVVGVFGSWAIGLAFALALRTKIPGNTVFKVLLLLPWIVPIVVSSTAWNFLVATPQSPLPVVLDSIGIHNALFLTDPLLAQITVCVFKVWISFPFMMMMMSSALASVDVNVYEAAKMDGANARQTFTGVTLPIIARTTFISWILMTIFSVNDFPTVFLLTQGGPENSTETLVVYSYLKVFQEYDTGHGVAIAFIMTFVLVVISVVLYRQITKANVE